MEPQIIEQNHREFNVINGMLEVVEKPLDAKRNNSLDMLCLRSISFPLRVCKNLFSGYFLP